MLDVSVLLLIGEGMFTHISCSCLTYFSNFVKCKILTKGSRQQFVYTVRK